MTEHSGGEAVPPDLPDPTNLAKGELAKSRETRTRILRAAVDCLADTGYAATSTNAVAARAGLTRAALLYHFPSKAQLIEATVHFVTRRRVEMQEEWQVDLPRDADFPVRSLESAWAQLQTPEFRAFSELSVAARTDAALAVVFHAAMTAFDLARRDMARRLAQPAVLNAPGFDLRRDIARFLMEGLAQQEGMTFDRERRFAELMQFLKALFSDPAIDPLLARIVREAERGPAATGGGAGSGNCTDN
ncbi:MAG: TetR/AcrR family transcriptional regulator [Pseudomonadales bacterium]|nr:TetR/AcrR family transcriptional regulator [Pseudomonadales bacterium]